MKVIKEKEESDRRNYYQNEKISIKERKKGKKVEEGKRGWEKIEEDKIDRKKIR